MSKRQKLNQLAKQIIENNVCAELASSAIQLVPGEGNPDAEIVFIGEAPGKKEDETGKPFVGASGNFLDRMMGTIGLDRGDVFITSIVKYRPPENRDPTSSEKEEFMPYLSQQIEIIKPQLIVTLGRHSGTQFLPSLKISRDHGHPKRINEQTFLFLYHPAAALYNGGMRQTLLEDFAKIPKILADIKKVNN